VYAFYQHYMPDSISWCLAEGYRIGRSAPPYGPCGLGRTWQVLILFTWYCSLTDTKYML